MLEMEHGKNYNTYFFESQVKCFYARKLYWKHIDGFNLESKDGIRLAPTFLTDDDDVYRYYEKNRENAYLKEETKFEKTKIKVEFFILIIIYYLILFLCFQIFLQYVL